MIEIKNLSFKYSKDIEIIKDVSFVAKPGEVTAIIGANGVGKTTILKCIAGLEKGGGSITVCGQNRKSLSSVKSSEMISYLSQNTACDAELNVFEIILLGLLNRLSFKVTEDNTKKVEEVMELMNISQFADRKISELSGGQQQLVFIAQTLIKDPKIIIMDEPTSALDLNKQFKLMNFLKDITQKRQFTTLLTLHHLDITARYADRVVVINEGGVYMEDSPENVFTEEMMEEVYSIESDIYKDRINNRHIIAVDTAG